MGSARRALLPVAAAQLYPRWLAGTARAAQQRYDKWASTTVYNSFGRTSASIDARQFRTTTLYDSFSRAAGSRDELGFVSTTIFDTFGRASGSLNALGNRTTLSFDILDRVTAQQNPLGFVATTVYDALGRQQAMIDTLGRRSTSIYDNVGRYQAGINALGFATTLVYDLRGSQIARLNARGFRTTTVFDADARPIVEVDPLARRATTVYDIAGERTQKIDGRGFAITYLFDRAAREQARQYRDGTRLTTVFDAVGQATGWSDSNGIWTRTFDGAGQLITEAAPSHPNGQPLTNLYDPTGDRAALVSWFGILTVTFDPRRSITGLRDPQGGRSTWTFDALARWTQQQLPDGSTATAAYDAAGRLTGVLHKTPGGAVIDQALMAYDAVDNPIRKVTLDGVDTMTYDAANQLMSEYHPIAGVKTWSFDPVGNRLSQGFTQVGVRTLTNWAYDTADQITLETTGTAVTTYTFDQAGNEQVVQTPSGRTTNTWDSENRLTGVQIAGGGLNTATYRADNLRHKMADSEGDKRMVWDELGYSGYIDPVQERTTAAALRSYYRGFMLAAMRDEGAAVNRNYHFDHQGTTQALTDGTGAVTDRFASDAWGVEVKRTGSSINRQWYIGNLGYQRQADQALDYARARYLRAGAGRWLSTDPRIPATRYTYVLNRPAQGGDPSGLWGPEVHEKCTERWARETYMPTGDPCCKFLIFDNPRFIASGDQGMDDPNNSAFFIYNWYIHFNYLDWRDWLKVIRGESLNGKPDTREENFRRQAARAVQLAQRNWCDWAMLTFGEGLHSIQDIYSHADLTPWEHRDVANHPYVDDPNCDRGRQFAHTDYCDACVPWLCNSYLHVRRFVFFPGRQRVKATEKRSRQALQDFLGQIANTGCVKCVDAAPSVDKPVCAPGAGHRCGDDPRCN